MKKLRKTGFSGACESLKKKCQEVCPQERFELRVELWEEGGIKVSSAQKSTESHSSRECSGAHCASLQSLKGVQLQKSHEAPNQGGGRLGTVF